MIKLFYTGSLAFNQPNTLPSKSLGGFISNTTVPNGVVNSLFSSLSLMDFYNEKKSTQYIGLGLYLFFFDKEESYERINLKFNLLDQENSIMKNFKNSCSFEVGLGPIGGDQTKGYYLEKIQSNAKPFYMLQDFRELILNEEVIFENVELKENGVGVWLKRTFDPDQFRKDFGFNSDYWETHDFLPNVDFDLKLNIDFEGIN